MIVDVKYLLTLLLALFGYVILMLSLYLYSQQCNSKKLANFLNATTLAGLFIVGLYAFCKGTTLLLF